MLPLPSQGSSSFSAAARSRACTSVTPGRPARVSAALAAASPPVSPGLGRTCTVAEADSSRRHPPAARLEANPA